VRLFYTAPCNTLARMGLVNRIVRSPVGYRSASSSSFNEWWLPITGWAGSGPSLGAMVRYLSVLPTTHVAVGDLRYVGFHPCVDVVVTRIASAPWRHGNYFKCIDWKAFSTAHTSYEANNHLKFPIVFYRRHSLTFPQCIRSIPYAVHWNKNRKWLPCGRFIDSKILWVFFAKVHSPRRKNFG